MPKVIFVLQRRPGTTREQRLEYRAGDRRTGLVIVEEKTVIDPALNV